MYLEYLWNLLSKDWRPVSREEATRHRYCGLRGWLLVLYVVAAYGVVTYSIDAMSPHNGKYYGTYGERPEVIRGVLLMSAVAHLPLLILGPLKHRLMPRLWIAGMWISAITSIAAYDMPGRLDSLILGIAMTIVGTALLTWYVLHSKRVNVTYLHRVPAGATDGEADRAKVAEGRIPKPAIYQRAQRSNRIFWGIAILFAIAVLAITLLDWMRQSTG